MLSSEKPSMRRTIYMGAYLFALTVIVSHLLSLIVPEVAFALTNSIYEGMYFTSIAAVTLRLLLFPLTRLPLIEQLVKEEYLSKIAHYSQNVAFIAALWGTVGLAVSIMTGSILYTSSAATKSPIIMNKATMVVFSFTVWIVFLVIHSVLGDEGIWGNKMLRIFYPLTALSGLFFAMMAGSFGGSFTGIGTVLEPVYSLFNIQRSELWVIPLLSDFSRAIVNSLQLYIGNVVVMPLIIGMLNLTILILILGYISSEWDKM